MLSRHHWFQVPVTWLIVLTLMACSPSADQIASQTATAQTAIAAKWTDTPTPTATATATATMTPTVTPLPMPTPEGISADWSLLVFDTFDQPSMTFPGGMPGPMTILLVDGKSVWKMASSRNVTGVGLVTPAIGNISDFYLSVEGRQAVCPTTCSYGLSFREGDAAGYRFTIQERKQTFSFQLTSSSGVSNQIFNSDTFASSIQPEGPNILAVLAEGSSISLFINDVLVTQVQNSTILSGGVGISVTAWGIGSKSEFEFDDFQVYG